MPDQHRFLLAGRRVPDDYRAVFSRRGNALAIARIADRIDRAAMFVEVRHSLALGNVPNENRSVCVSRDKPPAVRREADTPHQRVFFEGGYLRLRSSVPQNDIL